METIDIPFSLLRIDIAQGKYYGANPLPRLDWGKKSLKR
jgi:hypothetical protein